MTLSFRNTEKTIVILNDLIKINNDRIACYKQAIGDETNIDMDLRKIFKDIISEANDYKQELINKITELDRHPQNSITISGILHRAWVDLKVTLVGNTRNAIINFCLYNEEIAQHTYNAAMNTSKINKDIIALISKQQESLRNTYHLIKNYREAHSYLESRLVYFN